MTSQGQRFRRRALRRGYKVDEVDSFLDRVEATLAGEPVGGPVAAQDVHDVVFRVRFGGYDEWQVDLHLDRVERQLAELEERGGPGRGPDPRLALERPGPPMDRIVPPPGRMGPPDRMGPPMRDERQLPPPMAQPMPPRPVAPMPAQAGPGRDQYGRYDETYAPPSGFEPPDRFGGGAERFDGFEPGRHGKSDMTAEIRMPDRELRGPGYGGPPPMPAPPVGNPMNAPPMGPPPGYGPPPGAGHGAPGLGAPGLGAPGVGGPPVSAEAHRVDQLRRTFQPRRFGSGYDPMQVDRLFEGILAALSGRGPMPVSEGELETLQFGLVSGGYFEAEVDAALREVKDILRRR